MPDPTLDAARVRRRMALGRSIRRLRGAKTQAELGIALATYQPDGQSVPQTTVSRWEKGLVDLRLEQVVDLGAALGVKPAVLIEAGGYIGSPLGGDPIQSSTMDSLDDVIAVIRGIEALGIGIRVWNEWVSLGPEGSLTLIWRVEVTTQALGE